MAGPAFEPDAAIALPTASIAVMGPEAAVNAVYQIRLQRLPDERAFASFIAEKREEYKKDIDIYRLASEMVIDEYCSSKQFT